MIKVATDSDEDMGTFECEYENEKLPNKVPHTTAKCVDALFNTNGRKWPMLLRKTCLVSD